MSMIAAPTRGRSTHEADSTSPTLEDRCDVLMDSFRETGCHEAFDHLYRMNRERFEKTLRAMMRPNSARFEIDDVLSEVFLAIYKYPHRFRPQGPRAFRNWSFGIIKNTLHHFRRGRLPEFRDHEQIAESLGDESSNPVKLLDDLEQSRALRKTYVLVIMLYDHFFQTRLNEREQQVLWAVEVDGSDYETLAVRFGVRVGNLKMILCRARRKVRDGFILAESHARAWEDGRDAA